MNLQSATVALPLKLLQEIDDAIGTGERGAFLVEAVRAELRRRRLLGMLQEQPPAWKDEDHPELSAGSAAWVHGIRREEQVRHLGSDTSLHD